MVNVRSGKRLFFMQFFPPQSIIGNIEPWVNSKAEILLSQKQRVGSSSTFPPILPVADEASGSIRGNLRIETPNKA
jgi:hypothetical protein